MVPGVPGVKVFVAVGGTGVLVRVLVMVGVLLGGAGVRVLVLVPVAVFVAPNGVLVGVLLGGTGVRVLVLVPVAVFVAPSLEMAFAAVGRRLCWHRRDGGDVPHSGRYW